MPPQWKIPFNRRDSQRDLRRKSLKGCAPQNVTRHKIAFFISESAPDFSYRHVSANNGGLLVMNQINIETGTRMGALRLPFFMVLTFLALGVVAHMSGRMSARDAGALSFPGQEQLELVNPYRLMQHVVWLPFRDAQTILYRDLTTDSPVYKQEIHCLAQAVYFEARNEPVEGQMAVAQVVLNRVKSPDYPKSICGVVFQGADSHNSCQFSFACDGLPDEPAGDADDKLAWKRAIAISQAAVAQHQDDFTMDATHFHASYVDPDWAATLKPTVRFGHHIFYRDI